MEVVDRVASDEELAELALAAAIDPHLDDGAVPIRAVEPITGLLPDWYMPASTAHAQPGWRRRIALVVVGAILLINAAGLCVTYGPVTFG